MVLALSQSVTSDVEICNLAISTLGGTPFNRLDDDTTEAVGCRKWYVNTLECCLEKNDWQFAYAQTILQPLSSPAVEDVIYPYSYVAPSDLRKFVSASCPEGTLKFTGKYILTTKKYDNLLIEYTRNTPVEDMPATFKQYLVASLQVALCLPLTQDGSLLAKLTDVRQAALNEMSQYDEFQRATRTFKINI